MNWDTIVIGSGIGGLTAAAALAREGQRVLVLEQHDILGGMTQTFERQGFHFTTGLHYLTGVTTLDGGEGSLARLLNGLGDGTLRFQRLPAQFDLVRLVRPDGQETHFAWGAPDGDNWARLKALFPDEAATMSNSGDQTVIINDRYEIHKRVGRGGMADVFLARDRLGIKPLYYAELDGGLRFASTLPALLATDGIDTAIAPVALHHYMSFHAVVPAPHTIVAGVRKLPPATVRMIEPDGRSRDHCYWRLHFGMRGDDRERAREVEAVVDVPRLDDEFLDEHPVVAERVLGLVAAGREALEGLLVVMGDAQALAAAAGGCLDHHRVADVAGDFDSTLGGIDRVVVARDGVDFGFVGELLRGDLVAHRRHRLRLRADEGDAFLLQRLAERGPLGEESVARMHGLRAGLLARGNDLLGNQVGLVGRRRPDMHRLIGHRHMHRIAVCV